MKLNESIEKYVVVKNAFHGGGIVSYHRSLAAAEKAAKKYRGSCDCGCCGVIPIKDLQNVPTFTASEYSPYTLCK